VKAIHYRDDPILTACGPALPPFDSTSPLIALTNSETIWSRLEKVGIPGVKGVWCHSEAAGDALFIVVSIEALPGAFPRCWAGRVVTCPPG
jgi:4-hydroxy-3-polyprenylbenzoate decarboxylase